MQVEVRVKFVGQLHIVVREAESTADAVISVLNEFKNENLVAEIQISATKVKELSSQY